MLAARFLDRSVVIRELLPQDLKLEMERLTQEEAIAAAHFLAAVVGNPGTTDWRKLDVAALPGRITVDGDVRGEGVGADLLGHPLNSLAWLAGSSVAAAFDGLQPGQVILLGSVPPPIWLTGPASVPVEFPPLPPVSQVDCVTVRAPWLDAGGDGWTVARRGRVVGFVGSNLMKFGPLLGELLAAAVLSDGLPSDLDLVRP